MEKLFDIFAVIGFGVVLLTLCMGIGFILSFFEDKKKGAKETDSNKKKKYVTFTKKKFNIILNNALVWVYLSYVLAFMGKEQIAETLSITAVSTILGAFVTYAVKSFGEKKIGKEKEEYENTETEIYK